ncbi:MAG: hypothetical protein LBM41_04805 [Ruminococcus sp.]|jgi:hypothetical protein|nr:hypothetical protein [Ruminococcus sp.]
MPETKPETIERTIKKLKIIGIPAVILVIALLIGAYFLVKYISPIEPDVGFHFEEEIITLLDYYDDPNSSLSPYVDSDCTMYDENTFYAIDDNTIIKIDANKKQVVGRSKTFHIEEYVNNIIVLDDGNIAVDVNNGIAVNNSYNYLRKFTPDLQPIGDFIIPEELGNLRFNAYIDGIFYEVKSDTDIDEHYIYTIDENMNILTKEAVNIDFLQNYEMAYATAFKSADGKPALYWHMRSTDPDDPKQSLTDSGGYHYKNYITSFEAKPSVIIRLPQRNESDNYFYASTGDDEYPIYVDFMNTDLLFYAVFREDILGRGLLGVKWDGTTEKILVTNDEDIEKGTRPNYRTLLFLFGSHVLDGDIYSYEVESGGTNDDGTKYGPRLILRKLIRVYD